MKLADAHVRIQAGHASMLAERLETARPKRPFITNIYNSPHGWPRRHFGLANGVVVDSPADATMTDVRDYLDNTWLRPGEYAETTTHPNGRHTLELITDAATAQQMQDAMEVPGPHLEFPTVEVSRRGPHDLTPGFPLTAADATHGQDTYAHGPTLERAQVRIATPSEYEIAYLLHYARFDRTHNHYSHEPTDPTQTAIRYPRPEPTPNILNDHHDVENITIDELRDYLANTWLHPDEHADIAPTSDGRAYTLDIATDATTAARLHLLGAEDSTSEQPNPVQVTPPLPQLPEAVTASFPTSATQATRGQSPTARVHPTKPNQHHRDSPER